MAPDPVRKEWCKGHQHAEDGSGARRNEVPFGSLTISQRQHTVVVGLNYLTAFEAWRNIQNGAAAGQDQFDSQRRYIRNGRDLGQYIHVDALYEAYLNACLILLGPGAPKSTLATRTRPPPSRTPSARGVAHTS